MLFLICISKASESTRRTEMQLLSVCLSEFLRFGCL